MLRAIYVVLILFFVFMASDAFAETIDYSSRAAVISRELDCVSSHSLEEQEIIWADVCYTENKDEYEADPVHVGIDANKYDEDFAVPGLGDTYALHHEESQEESVIKEDRNAFYRFFDFSDPLNKFEFGSEAFDYKYEEPGLMELNGYMTGVFAVYTHRTSENEHFESWKDAFSMENAINVFRLDSRASFGLLDYESNGTGTNDNEDHYVFELRALVGEDVPVSETVRVTPYLGFGYRYLWDNGGGDTTTTGHWTYDRESNYYYLPLGVEVEKSLKDNWSVMFTVEYDIFIDGEQISHLEDGPAGANYDELKNDQNNGSGFRNALRITKETEKIDFFVEAFARFWKIEDSDISALTRGGQVIPVPGNPGYIRGGLEPDNETTEYGLKAGARF